MVARKIAKLSLVQRAFGEPEFQLKHDPDWQSALLFETPEQIYARVYRELRPTGVLPRFCVRFYPFANADSKISLRDGEIRLKITDLLEGAPAPVAEALAYVLLGKLLRRPVSPTYLKRYRLYLNRKDIRQKRHLLRQVRGRKFVSGPQGDFFDLAALFDRLNAAYFDGLLGQPQLGWSRTRSRTLLGHFDPSHNAIIISRIFDHPQTPPLALEFVVFHEMLHLRYPVDHSRSRRCVHTREFKEAEKKFARWAEAQAALQRI